VRQLQLRAQAAHAIHLVLVALEVLCICSTLSCSAATSTFCWPSSAATTA